MVVGELQSRARGVHRIGFPREGLWKLWTGYSEDFGDLDKIMMSWRRLARATGCSGLPKLPSVLTAR